MGSTQYSPYHEYYCNRKYLARYVNRVAISNNRLQYLKDNHKVIFCIMITKIAVWLPAPKAFKETRSYSRYSSDTRTYTPLISKTRKYGLHHHSFKCTPYYSRCFTESLIL
ncbi:MAG: transposase [Saprospiraceae bacterium]|nr:transposase [Saprospiraceae bacterium]